MAPVKVNLDLPTPRDAVNPNTTFRTTEMAGSWVLGSARFIRHY